MRMAMLANHEWMLSALHLSLKFSYNLKHPISFIMARVERVIEKIQAKPTPANIRWDELVAALRHLGYEVINSRGSRRKFHHPGTNHLISLHQPHPHQEVLPCYIRQVRDALEETGLIPTKT